MCLFWKGKKKQKQLPQNTHKTYHIRELHVSFRIYEGVGNTSEVDFPLLNADEQMELMEPTTTMLDRQNLAATAIIAQI